MLKPVGTAEMVSVSATETSANIDKRTLKRKRNEGADLSDREEQALLEAKQKSVVTVAVSEQQRRTGTPAAQQIAVGFLSNAEQHAHLPAGLTVQMCLQQDDQSCIAAPHTLHMQAVLAQSSSACTGRLSIKHSTRR